MVRARSIAFVSKKWIIESNSTVSTFFWEPVYHYVFPAWARWLIPPAYGLFFALVALLFWWLSFHLPGQPVLNFCILGGSWGTLTHSWAVSRGILDKPRMLRGVSPMAAAVMPFFEFMFHWCVIVAVASAIRRWSGQSQAEGGKLS
jgi:hypothetical protein